MGQKLYLLKYSCHCLHFCVLLIVKKKKNTKKMYFPNQILFLCVFVFVFGSNMMIEYVKVNKKKISDQ